MHNLVVELLIFLVDWGARTKKLDGHQKMALYGTIMIQGDPIPHMKIIGLLDEDIDPNDHEAVRRAEQEYERYARFDISESFTNMYDLAMGRKELANTDWGGEEEGEDDDDNQEEEEEEEADNGDSEEEGDNGDSEDEDKEEESVSLADPVETSDEDLGYEKDPFDGTQSWETKEEREFLQRTVEDNDYHRLEPNQRRYLHLLATLGRRSLSLAVVRWGKASLFKRRLPTHVWDFKALMDAPEITDEDHEQEFDADRYVLRDARTEVDNRIYPLRVIDTYTLELEEDQTLYASKYAVFSHTWIHEGGREVTYDTVNRFLYTEKSKKVKLDLENHQKELAASSSQQLTDFVDERAVRIGEINEIIKNLNQELAVIEVAEGKERAAHDFEETQRSEWDLTRNRNLKRNLGPIIEPSKKEDAGYAKLRGCIDKARSLGYQYVWVDTCCINKANNTELNESISSMGDWYKNADICLAYIGDFQEDNLAKVGPTTQWRWATRGWTLQELVMSGHVVFYNRQWEQVFDTANRTDEDSMKALSVVCKVPVKLIACGGKATGKMAASAILSLAAERTTFKPEDAAYSLMGMLNVRITPDYGEKLEKALSRLLDAVLRNSNDVTVFNWIRDKKIQSYPGSKLPGKSLYPVDFSGYKKRAKLAEDHQVLADKKPVSARSEVTVGISGVNSRFDIWQPSVVIEGDNKKMYRVVKRLKKARLTTDIQKDKVECVVRCVFRQKEDSDKEDLKIHVYCTLDVLEKQLEVELRINPTLNSAWVIARFSRAYGANWFLAALAFDPKLSQYALFAERFLAQKLPADDNYDNSKVGHFMHFMHYIESDGFPATKLETDHIEDKYVPMDTDDDTEDPEIKNVNLWVG